MAIPQRVPVTWGTGPRVGHAIRLLVESDDPVLAVSDFSVFREAGILVAHCGGSGPERRCPLLQGEPCSLVAGADVVLHRLGPDPLILEALGRHHPDVPVVVVEAEPGGVVAVPDGAVVLPAGAPVESQIRAIYRAALR